MVAAANYLGLSRAMGALIGGVSISTFPYNLDVLSKLTSLRDFFVTLFFVALGAQIPKPTLPLLLAAIGSSLFITASRYLTVTPLLLARRSGHRVSLIPAINLANVSEFSIVIAAMGFSAHHISKDAQTLLVLTFALCAMLATYKITYNFDLQRMLSRLLKRCGVHDLDQQERAAAKERPRLMLLGFAKVASTLFEEIERHAPGLKEGFTVVDFNPEAVHALRHRGVNVYYGDISHADTLRHAGVEQAEIIISSIPDYYLKGITNLHLVRMLRRINPQAAIVATAETFTAARELYQAGAAYVMTPRLTTATDLLPMLHRLREGLPDAVRQELVEHVTQRREIIP